MLQSNWFSTHDDTQRVVIVTDVRLNPQHQVVPLQQTRHVICTSGHQPIVQIEVGMSEHIYLVVLVRVTGLEPVRPKPADFKSAVVTNFTTPAMEFGYKFTSSAGQARAFHAVPSLPRAFLALHDA